MDYNELLDEAKRRQHLATDYKLAKALGYKNISTIYQVRAGKKGLRAERLMKLLQLAGKAASVAFFSAALLSSSGISEARAANTLDARALHIMSNRRTVADSAQARTCGIETNPALCRTDAQMSATFGPCFIISYNMF